MKEAESPLLRPIRRIAASDLPKRRQ